MINLKKIALVVLGALVVNQINADTFLGKLINNHPYLTALGCVAMGGVSYLVGNSARVHLDGQGQFLNQIDIKQKIDTQNVRELKNIFECHKLFPANITVKNMHNTQRNLTQKQCAKLAAINYNKNVKKEDYCIRASRSYQSTFPEDQHFVKYVIHEHEVCYLELPPVKMQDENMDEWVIPTKRYELEIKKQNRWIPKFCYGVSALNFASAIGFAAYGFTKKV